MTSSSDSMIRIQISLDTKQYALPQREAEALGISVEKFMRRAIRNALPAPGGPWMRYAGFVESENPQSSRSIDKIVYGR